MQPLQIQPSHTCANVGARVSDQPGRPISGHFGLHVIVMKKEGLPRFQTTAMPAAHMAQGERVGRTGERMTRCELGFERDGGGAPSW